MKSRHSLPGEVYAFVEQTPETVLLEGGGAPRQGNDRADEEPWTRLFTAPFRVCTAYEPAEIPGLFAAIEEAVASGKTAAGFFSYECGACFEPKAKGRQSPEDPLAWIGLYERSYAFDHTTGEFVDGTPPGLNASSESSVSGHDFSRAEDVAPLMGALAPEGSLDFEFDLSEAEYAERIAAIHEWIRSGDVYQLNFTAPGRIKSTESPAALYASLRARQPVDYGAFLHWQPGRRILSFSPELFFRVRDEGRTRRITTRPMKGTAPRGRTTAEDRANAEWLRNDPKNRSENVMIVDLLRNDLGRLARFGSVAVKELFAPERYPTLWQMTSTVTGELRPEVGFEDIFRALFPSGSVTGAPKVRAMQLIAEIEDRPRGVYTGAIGFFSQRESVFNVAIRTLDLEGNSGVMGAGSGIVIDSEAAAEYREVLLKAKFLRSALRQPVKSSLPDEFSLIESLLWDGSFPSIDLHLDRLQDSADYFDFLCDREDVKAALLARAAAFSSCLSPHPPQMHRAPSFCHPERAQRVEGPASCHSGAKVGNPETSLHAMPRKVRLLMNADGSVHITDEILEPTSGAEHVGRVRIAQERTDSADVMLFHKTTHRPLYALAFNEAAQKGYEDVLFLNQRGEVTEGAISNVFVEKDGRWMTPPIECGLLAGVYRRHLLETRLEIEERVLFESDLRTADAVYLANAVRGLRRVAIDWDSSDPA